MFGLWALSEKSAGMRMRVEPAQLVGFFPLFFFEKKISIMRGLVMRILTS
jgi:hypothetical protein